MTQKDKILQAFAENNNILTPGDIMRLGIAQYNARIFELKEKGHLIESEDFGYQDGVHMTRFKYKGQLGKYVPSTAATPQNFPSRIHEIAHLNRARKIEREEQLTFL